MIADAKEYLDNKAARERADWMIATAEHAIEQHGLRDITALVVIAGSLTGDLLEASVKYGAGMEDAGDVGNLAVRLGAIAHQILAKLKAEAAERVSATPEQLGTLVREYRAAATLLATNTDLVDNLDPEQIKAMIDEFHDMLATAIGAFTDGKSLHEIKQRSGFAADLDKHEGFFLWDTAAVFLFGMRLASDGTRGESFIESRTDAIDFNQDGTIDKEDTQ